MSCAQFRLDRYALLALVLLLTVYRSPVQSASPDAPSALSQPSTDVKQVLEPTSGKLAPQVGRLLQLDPKTYTWDEFPTHVDDAVPVSLIIAIKDYGPGFNGLIRTLDDMARCYSWANVTDVLLTHYGDTDALPFDVIENFSASLRNYKFVHPDVKKAHITLGEAFNKAAKLATSPTLIFLTDVSYGIKCQDMRAMARALRHPDVGIVAPKIVDTRTAGQTVFSSGISFVLGKNPHKSTWNNWSEGSSAASQALAARTDVPYLIHRYQGYSSTDSRVSEAKEVFGASKYAMAISKANFDLVNGFDPAFKSAYLDIDLSMRLKKTAGKKTIYVPRIQVGAHGELSPADDILNGDFSQNDQVKMDNKLFSERWADALVPELTIDYQTQNITLAWSMDCGTGSILGFTTEAVNIIMSLQHRIRMKVINDAAKCKVEMAKIGFPASIIKTIDILAHKDDRDHVGQHLAISMHKDPGRYDATYAFNPPELLIGRSMFETDSVPQNWIHPTTSIDFVWVPSEFNRQTFTAGGVNASKIEVLPELIDLLHFDPNTTSKSTSQSTFEATGLHAPEVLPDAGRFNFLSVFKWEERKDWKTLFSAFYEEFATSKDVKLYIRSNMDHENEKEFENWRAAYLASKQLSEADLPKIEFLSRFVPYWKLPKLYKAASAFVTATHGEGWGLPIMEAMSMSLPVIATNWSGITQFVTSDTAILLESTLVPVTNGQPGHKWAQVSVEKLRAAMRQLVDNPQLCETLGEKARAHMLESFSAEAISNQVIAKLLSHQPHFDHFKANRRNPPTQTGSYNARYGNVQFSATPGHGSTWSTPKLGMEKCGLTLTRGKLSD